MAMEKERSLSGAHFSAQLCFHKINSYITGMMIKSDCGCLNENGLRRLIRNGVIGGVALLEKAYY